MREKRLNSFHFHFKGQFMVEVEMYKRYVMSFLLLRIAVHVVTVLAWKTCRQKQTRSWRNVSLLSH